MTRCCSSKTSRRPATRSSGTPKVARSDDVFKDDVRLDAILLNLHVIGEAVKKLPEDLRSRHPKVAWREIAGLRDFISHAYFALDLDIIWDAIRSDVPALLDAVRRIIETEKQGGV